MEKNKKYFITSFVSLLCAIFLLAFEMKLELFNKTYVTNHWDDFNSVQGVEIIRINLLILFLSLVTTVSSGVSVLAFAFRKKEMSIRTYIIGLSIMGLIFIAILVFMIINIDYLSDLIYKFYYSLLYPKL